MWFSNWFGAIANAVTALTCCAIAILLIFQLRRDAKGQSLARLMIIMTANSFLSVFMRIFAITGYGVHDIFLMIVITTASLPYGLYTFTNDYFEAWTCWRRWFARTLAALLIAVAFGCVLEIVLRTPVLFESVIISPDGLVMYQYGPHVYLDVSAILVGELGLLLAAHMVIQKYRQTRNTANQRLMFGVLIIALGIMSIPIPHFEVYAFEQIPYVIGAVILASVVIQQRLFDPISQLNIELKYRADQMSLINSVGHHANSLLVLNSLLNAVVHDIQQTFKYYSVTIYLPDHNGQLVARATAGEHSPQMTFDGASISGEPKPDFVLSGMPNELLYIPDTSKNKTDYPYLLMPDALSEVSVPLKVGGLSGIDETMIGILEIQDAKPYAFTSDDLKVIQILTRQIAVAVHNAELFEEKEQANAAKTNFINYISHEIRNPIGNILHTINFVTDYPQFFEDTTLPDVYRAELHKVMNEAQLVRNLVDDILDLAKIEAGTVDIDIKEVDPYIVLEKVRESAKIRLHSNVHLNCNYPSPLPVLLADELRLRQILTNITGNAVKFTRAGAITLNAVTEAGMLQFSVSDTGPGISPDTMDKLFQPFSQISRELTREHGGVGLGLAISKRLVELQGGEIWVASEVGKGTTFYFTLPLANGRNNERGTSIH